MERRSSRLNSEKRRQEQVQASTDKLPDINQGLRNSKKKFSETLRPLELGQVEADRIINGIQSKQMEAFHSHRSLSSRGGVMSSVGQRQLASELKIDDKQGQKTSQGSKLLEKQQELLSGPNIDFHGIQAEKSAKETVKMTIDALDDTLSAVVIQKNSRESRNSKLSLGPASSRKKANNSKVSQRGNSARRIGSRKSSRNAFKKPVNPWQDFDVSSITTGSLEPTQIIEKLKQLTRNVLPFCGNMLSDDELVSTDPLDSFIVAFNKIIKDNSFDFNEEVRSNIHLATGTKTEFCEQLLTYVCHHQKLEAALRDSVNFFMESLNTLVRLEQENKSMKQQIGQLLELKEGDILEKYGLQKHLDHERKRVQEVAERERQAKTKIEQLQSMLQDKIAECDSLQYRLRHIFDNGSAYVASARASKPESSGKGAAAEPNLESIIINPDNQAISDNMANSQVSLQSFQKQVADSQRLQNLQSENSRLNEEVNTLKQVLTSKDDSLHLRKMQDLFNQLQVENKNLRIYNQKCETKLTSKQNLIDHLESKVNKVLTEKEEIIINLKSDIVMLKKSLEQSEEQQQNQLKQQELNLRKEFQITYSSKIQSLELNGNGIEKERADLRQRLVKLNQEHQILSDEFDKFRQQKELQEDNRNQQYTSLEQRIQNLQQDHEEKKEQLTKQIELSENQAELLKKENNILIMRQKYLKQSTETLLKQKVFLFETVSKGKEELHSNLLRMEDAMLASNNNQEYLVPVKRCIREAKEMGDMGCNMLVNISQILKFLKIEKLHQLLSSESEMNNLQLEVQQAMNQQQFSPDGQPQQSILDQIGQNFVAAKKPETQNAAIIDDVQINRFMNQIGANEHENQTNTEKEVFEQKEQISDYSFEFASILNLLKALFIQTGICQSELDIPKQLKILINQLQSLKAQPVLNQKDLLIPLNDMTEKVIKQFKQQIDSSKEKKETSSLINEDDTNQDLKLKQAFEETDQLRVKLERQQLDSKNLQLNLAGKIITLEEHLETLNDQHEEQIKQLEIAQQEELNMVRQAVEQEKQQLLIMCNDYHNENKELKYQIENNIGAPNEQETIKKMEQGTKGNLYQEMKNQYEDLFKKNCELLKNYQNSINEFVYLREDLRGSFTLAFETEKLDQSGLVKMLTEDMLKYYLSKAFLIDKTKFRFLRTEELFEKKQGNQNEIKILRIIIEVIAENQHKVAHLFKSVKAQIKDGTSLLYDFMPLYFGMNLGSSGFSTHHNLNQFSLLSKTGQSIDGQDYIVSVMRHQTKPLIFKIIAFNLELREEFMVELSESDIYELVEGEQQILKSLEPDKLVKKICTNLSIITRDKIKVLTCDQKIFFNELWMKNMESNKNIQLHQQTPFESNWFGENTSAQQFLTDSDRISKIQDSNIKSKLTNTAIRTTQLSKLQEKNPKLPADFNDKFNTSVKIGTDFVISDLYEGFESVYRGVQNLGETTKMRLSILESTKTKTLLFTFDDLQSLKKLKFSLYEKDTQDQYIIHLECMKIEDGHHVMVGVEQIQEQGLMIRMYDMASYQAVQFALIRKQNGQYTRLADDQQFDLIMRQDFRNFIYRLAFLANTNEINQIMQEYRFLFESDQQGDQNQKVKQQQETDVEIAKRHTKRDSIFKQMQSKLRSLPRRRRALSAIKFSSFALKAFQKDRFSYLKSQQSSTDLVESSVEDWRDRDIDKGMLLYRQVFYVRCQFDGDLQYHESVITMYLKDHLILMEVILYKDPSQISISSEMNAIDLFSGEDPANLPFKDMIFLLNKMLDKFFIISDNGSCQMKVEIDAISIHDFIAQKALETQQKQNKDRVNLDQAMIQNTMQQQILEEKDQYISRGEAKQFKIFSEIDGEVHDISILFVFKPKTAAKTEKSGARATKKSISKYGRQKHEIRQQYIEEFIETSCQWHQILFSVVDSSKETINCLFTSQKLAQMLSKDEFFERKTILSNYDSVFLDYIKDSIKLNKEKGDVYLENTRNVERNIIQKFKFKMGGEYVDRADLKLTIEEQRVVTKQLICNEEISFCQQLYDIKVFEMCLNQSQDTICYQFEIFVVSDPTEIYVYNYPLNFSPQIQDPHNIVIDIFNLMNSPLKKWDKKVNETKRKRQPSQAQLEAEKQKTEIQQQLFRKYLDNRLLLTIQEQRFPRKLDVMLIEPCSSLMWRRVFKPKVMTNKGLPLGSLQLIDQATLEMLVSVFIDQIDAQQSFQTLIQPKQYNLQAKFSEINEDQSENYLVSQESLIENELELSIYKEQELLNISLGKPQMDGENVEDQKDQLLIRLSLDQGEFYISKIVKLQGLNYVQVQISQQGKQFEINVLHLKPDKIQTIFQFSYLNEEQIQDTEREINNEIEQGKLKIFTKEDVKRSILDCLRRYYGSSAIDQAVRICALYQSEIAKQQDNDYEPPTIFEKMPEKPESIHKTRIINKFKDYQREKIYVFHRKALFDTDREKLLVLMIRIVIEQELVLNELKIKEPPNNFSIVIMEPESEQEIQFQTQLEACLTEEELNGNFGDLRELKTLRKLARNVLEDRIDVRKNFNDEGALNSLNRNDVNDKILDNYQISINFQQTEQEDENKV